MKKCVLVIGICIFFFTSCKKKDSPAQETTNSTTPASVADYYPLSVGNYWVYQNSMTDSNGTFLSQSSANDSIVVNKDTLINSKTYHIITEYNCYGNPANTATYYYMDSADCIVNNYGNIVFSVKTPGIVYTKVYQPDTFQYINYSFISTPTSITVPKGTYNCVDFLGALYQKNENYSKAYYLNHYYYKNIGTIKKEMMFSASHQKMILELLSYHVQ